MKPRPRILSISVLLASVFLAPRALATPGIDLALRKTKHFELLIDKTRVSQLDSLAPLAEAMWERLALTTGYRPKKAIRVVFHDEDDYANGWALATNNWVNIWLTPTPFELRGGVDWVRDVMSHELAHLFTLKALEVDGHLLSVGLLGAFERDRFSGAADLQWRPDDLEAWLAEGLAQVGAESCRFDRWDAHRDMLEHVAWKTGRILSDGLLRDFWGDSRESEQIYNQGYSFVRWVLLTSTVDLPTLLRQGARMGLRKAIEQSVGKPFPLAFAAWKAWLGSRHGEPTWPVEEGRSVGALDKATTWVSEGAAVGDSTGRVWVVSSRSNDYGIGSLWEFNGDRSRKLSLDVVGRLHLSPSSDRLVVIREETWPDRRTLRDLWTYRPDDGTWKRITVRTRVQEADFHPDGFVAIVRENGRNQPVLLGADGTVSRRLPLPSSGDLVQIASRSDGRIAATTMGLDGFRLLLLSPDSGWTGWPGLDAQARDPSFVDGRLWYAHLDSSGRWIACSQGDDGISVREAASEGGVLAPYPVSSDSLLVSRYQREGFVASLVPRGRESVLSPIPTAQPIPIAPGGPVVQPIATKARKAAEAVSLVGYGIQAGYISQRDVSQRFVPGDKWVTAVGAYATNSNMETTLEAGIQVLHGGPGNKAGWDKGFSIQASTEAWSPLISVGFGSMQTTLEHQGNDSLTDTLFVGDTLPFVTSTVLNAQVVQMLSSRSYLFGMFERQNLGVGVRRLTGDYSIDLQTTTQALVGWGWSWSEPGRFGTLSGAGLGVAGGRLWNKVPVAAGTMPDIWAYQGQASLNAHFRRRVLLELDLQAVLFEPDRGEASATSTAMASVGIPLPIPSFGIPLTRHRGWTFVDPILRLGHAADFVPASNGLDNFRPNLRSGAGDTRWSGVRRGIRRIDPLRVSGDVEMLQASDAELSWKVLVLANVATRWSVGASFPAYGADLWKSTMWRASISL